MVNILISAYNGERFINQQIESILNQTYQEYHIYVRDDGSTDETIQKVQKYVDTDEVTLIRGNNLGFAGSFLELLRLADEGDYWAFCDQDDVWHENKIMWAIEWLSQQDETVPCLFHSAFENVGMNLEHINYYLPPKYDYDFQRALTECLYMGFSMVINKKLRQMMLKCDSKNIVSHDWLAQLIAVAFGKCKFDARVATKHRRHSGSITLDNGKNKITWLIHGLVGQNKIANNAVEFERVYGNDLKEDEKELIKLFANDSCFKNNLKKAFYPRRWRPIWYSEVMLRVLMLLGKS